MPRVGIRCDAGPAIGAGHLVRCTALAEELLVRGAEVEFLADLGGLGAVPWVRELLRGLPVVWSPPPADGAEFAAAARRRALDAVVLDSYTLDPACAGLLRRAGTTVLAIVDEDARGQDADVYLDQNLGADELPVHPPAGSVRLAGARYVLLRDAVRRLRPRVPRPRTPAPRPGTPVARPGTGAASGVPSVLCVFGGTDAAGVAPVVLALAASTGAPFAATVVAASDATATALRAVALRPGQSVEVIPPTGELPALAVEADLVVSAAGSSTWEMLCLGVPTALVRVAENQRRGYDMTVGRGLAAGLGGPRDGAAAATVLHGLLTDPACRARLAARGHAAIDGRGRERVADVLLGRIGAAARAGRSERAARSERTGRAGTPAIADTAPGLP